MSELKSLQKRSTETKPKLPSFFSALTEKPKKNLAKLTPKERLLYSLYGVTRVRQLTPKQKEEYKAIRSWFRP